MDLYFSEPIHAPDMLCFRHVDIYHSSTDSVVKQTITEHFTRIVIAFGMRIDCPDVGQAVSTKVHRKT